MLKQFIRWGLLAAGGWCIAGCTVIMAPTQQPSRVRQWVAPVRQSVATVVAFNLDGEIAAIGSGFFIDRNGTLVTNYHVLEDSSRA
jgi:S1-C subfamily serine protease